MKKVIAFIVILIISVFLFFSSRINKIRSELERSDNTDLIGKLSRVENQKKLSLVEIGKGNPYLLMDRFFGRDSIYGFDLIYTVAQPGDSIYKPAKSDTIKIIKQNGYIIRYKFLREFAPPAE